MKASEVKAQPKVQKIEWYRVSQKRPKKLRGQDFTPILFCMNNCWGQSVCAGRYSHIDGKYTSLQGMSYDVDVVTGWAMIPGYPFRGRP